MKRPNPEDYKNYECPYSFDYAGYICDLKSYCEELEKALKINSHRHYVIAKRSRERMRILEKSINNFTAEILDFPDEDILIEVVCRKLYKNNLIDRKKDEWVTKYE